MSIKQTFWKLLDVYDVEIPIIQRDYAQGRDSDKAAEIRKGFVRHLFDMINDTSRSEDLDFIYGSVRDDSLILLDGQQRLTTLFLLHWYLSTGASQVECANKKLSRFRYETRVSSREFLQSLLKNSTDLDLFTIEGKLSDKIKDAHWFFSVWNNDPTVQSMLTMLDEIHRVFAGSIDRFDTLWGNLICDENPPVTFHFLNMDEFSLTDELYIKMNARGRGLSEFENFKAWLQLQFDESSSEEFKDLFFSALDKEWTDLIWRRRDKGVVEVDGYYLRFFKNVALFNLAGSLTVSSNKIAEIDKVWVDLLRSDKALPFQVLGEKKCFNERAMVDIHSFLQFVCNAEKGGRAREIVNASFDYAIKGNDYSEQVKFYALYSYVTNLKLNESLDSEAESQLLIWLGIITRLIDNTTIDSQADLVRAVHSLISITPFYSGEIYTAVSKMELKDIPYFSERQRKEEILKSQLIIEDTAWQPLFSRFENHEYFYGQIGFLIQRARTDDGGFDMVRFEKEGAQAEVLFSRKMLTRDDFLLQRALLSIGDYMVQKGSNFSFCKNSMATSRERNENWRSVFNDEKEGQHYLFKLMDRLVLGDEVTGLLKIVSESKTNDWRQLFIDYPETIAYCKASEARFDYYGAEEIYLLNSVRMSGKHRGLYSYSTYLEVLRSEDPALAPLKEVMEYNTVSGDDESPAIVFKPWHDGNLMLKLDDEEEKGLVLSYWDQSENPDTVKEEPSIIALRKVMDRIASKSGLGVKEGQLQTA